MTVCKNRELNEVAIDIVNIATKHLTEDECSRLIFDSKSIKIEKFNKQKQTSFKNKITFLEKATFENVCVNCSNLVEKDGPMFLHGKSAFHVLCGIESLADEASSNIFYKRWLMGSKKIEKSEEKTETNIEAENKLELEEEIFNETQT